MNSPRSKAELNHSPLDEDPPTRRLIRFVLGVGWVFIALGSAAIVGWLMQQGYVYVVYHEAPSVFPRPWHGIVFRPYHWLMPLLLGSGILFGGFYTRQKYYWLVPRQGAASLPK